MWKSEYIHYKMWDGFAYPFSNINDVEVWEGTTNFTPHFTGHLITYQCWYFKLNHVYKIVPREWTFAAYPVYDDIMTVMFLALHLDVLWLSL